MKAVPEPVLADLAGRFGYAPAELTYLGGGREDSDGVAYRTQREGKPFVFKIIGANGRDVDALRKVECRAAFFAHLGEQGIGVVSPVKDEAGNLAERAVQGEDAFLAYQYPFLTGVHPGPEQWDETMLMAWGGTLGLAHRMAQTYPIREGIKSHDGMQRLLWWEGEAKMFEYICEDPEVKAAWVRMQERLHELSWTPATGGFIHNDPHMQNILLHEGGVTLLDFDVSACHFYACDLAIAIQSVLFTQGGGMDRPVQNQGRINWFTNALLKGYAQAGGPLQDFAQIELFIAYRRLLLWTVMQGWLATKPDARAMWQQLILTEPKVLP